MQSKALDRTLELVQEIMMFTQIVATQSGNTQAGRPRALSGHFTIQDRSGLHELLGLAIAAAEEIRTQRTSAGECCTALLRASSRH